MERLGREQLRPLKQVTLRADFVVAGGGLAGTCAAINAAREGCRVILVQDRPVLGGNASSEVRLWALGATSHMGNNNRWSREGGVIDEILTENLWRNPEGNPVVFDSILLDFAWNEPRLEVLLDTAVTDLEMSDGRIRRVHAFASMSSTRFLLEAPLFCDATGDGILGYRAGAAFRVGAEPPDEFDEPLAPGEDYGELLGSTIYFYSKDTGKPVTFVAPDFALKDISRIPRHDRIRAADYGCSFWWLEYGGRLDTIDDAAQIKRELLKVVYGIWDHIKNSGRFPEARTMTLEWVGMFPGKRESRRFEGDYMLTQADLVGQRTHADAVSFGGWAIDLHPADGVYSDKPPCTQYHARGVYQIPYRCLYSRDVPNLFLAGRLISASHVAFGSTRVMLTGAHNGQVAGVAAALCRERGLEPRDLGAGAPLAELQRRLVRAGQFIPHHLPEDPEDWAPDAAVTASGTLVLSDLEATGGEHALDAAEGMLLPFAPGPLPTLGLRVRAEGDTTLHLQLRRSARYGNFSPDDVLAEQRVPLAAGHDGLVRARFDLQLERPEYLTVAAMPNPDLVVRENTWALPGVLHLTHGANTKVARAAVQEPPAGSGVERLEFWLPTRRPDAPNWSMTFDPPLTPYRPGAVVEGYERPFLESGSWAVRAPEPGAPPPELRLGWDGPRSLRRIILAMDGDHDNAAESVQLGHILRVSPMAPRSLEILDDSGAVLATIDDAHRPRWDVTLERAVVTESLRVRVTGFWGKVAAIYRVRVFGG